MHTQPKAPYCLLKLKKLRFGDYYKYQPIPRMFFKTPFGDYQWIYR